MVLNTILIKLTKHIIFHFRIIYYNDQTVIPYCNFPYIRLCEFSSQKTKHKTKDNLIRNFQIHGRYLKYLLHGIPYSHSLKVIWCTCSYHNNKILNNSLFKILFKVDNLYGSIFTIVCRLVVSSQIWTMSISIMVNSRDLYQFDSCKLAQYKEVFIGHINVNHRISFPKYLWNDLYNLYVNRQLIN